LRFGRTLQYQVNLSKLIKGYKECNPNDPFDKYSYYWRYIIPHAVSDLLTIGQFYLDHYLYLHKVIFLENNNFISLKLQAWSF